MRQFVKVPHVLLDLDETDIIKYTLIAILRYRKGNGRQIKVTLNTLSKITGLQPRQLTNNINRLIQTGLISRKQSIHGNNEFGSNMYTLDYDDNKAFEPILWDIVYSEKLPITAKVGYCKIYRSANKKTWKLYADRTN